MLRTSASGCSSSPSPSSVPTLPTPTVDDANNETRDSGEFQSLTRVAARELLPTPTGSEAGNVRRGGERGAELLLGGVAESLAGLLPTPTATDSEASGGSSPKDVTLTDAVERTAFGTRPNPRHLLPTPVEAEGRKAGTQTAEEKARTGQVWLSNVVQEFAEPLLPTPAASLVNDGEDAEQWQARRDHHASKTEGATRAGMPLPVAVQNPNWGKYAAAVERAEAVSGRPAPTPTRPDGKEGRHRLSPEFVEWMMFLPAGHVCGRGLTRTQELARLGNGVVPLQAAAAVGSLIGRLAEGGTR